MMIDIEIFRKCGPGNTETDGVDKVFEDNADKEIRRAERLERAGFSTVAKRIKAEAAIAEQRARFQHPDQWYERISEEDYRIWEFCLPRSYIFMHDANESPLFTYPSNRRYFQLSWYDYDVPPDLVIDELAFCRGMTLFESYMIRTPESRTIRDPILIGMKDGKSRNDTKTLYMIARWGESLVDFAVLRRRYGFRANFRSFVRNLPI